MPPARRRRRRPGCFPRGRPRRTIRSRCHAASTARPMRSHGPRMMTWAGIRVGSISVGCGRRMNPNTGAVHAPTEPPQGRHRTCASAQSHASSILFLSPSTCADHQRPLLRTIQVQAHHLSPEGSNLVLYKRQPGPPIITGVIDHWRFRPSSVSTGRSASDKQGVRGEASPPLFSTSVELDRRQQRSPVKSGPSASGLVIRSRVGPDWQPAVSSISGCLPGRKAATRGPP